MFTRSFAVLLLVGLASCSTALSPAGAKVKVLSQQEANVGKCTSITDLTSVTASGDSENSLNEARNKAANIGADAITIDASKGLVLGGYSKVTALRCP